jgi:hypothetical protein
MPPLELSPGRYWFDLFPVDQEPFAKWRAEHPDRVHVRTTSTNSDVIATLSWVLFDVSEGPPLLWPLPGRPTRAGEDVNGPEDVVQRPDPEPDPIWKLDASLPSMGTLLGAAALIGGLAFLAGRAGRR